MIDSVEVLYETCRRLKLEIAREICERAGRGKPTHAQLGHDIQTAAFVAVNSPKFRALIERSLTP